MGLYIYSSFQRIIMICYKKKKHTETNAKIAMLKNKEHVPWTFGELYFIVVNKSQHMLF